MKRELNLLDCVKGVAILSVVLFHLGVLQYGWLGVDVFFCVAGFLTMRSVLKRDAERFEAVRFLKSRLARLYPVALLALCLTLAFACILMIPPSLWKCSKGIFAVVSSAYNVWMWHCAQDYWSDNNAMNPLMHYWYLCALIQAYVVFSVVFVRAKGISSLRNRTWVLMAVAVVSLTLVILFRNDLPFVYYMPFLRISEFALGVLLAWSSFAIPQMPCSLGFRVIGGLGVMSYSLYIWHQIAFGFVVYATDWMDGMMGKATVAVFALIFSYAMYALFENRLFKDKAVVKCFIPVAIIALVAGASYVCYNRGVLSDIPEMGIEKRLKNCDCQALYVDRVRQLYAKPFCDDGRVKLLIVGNSFARDIVNVFLESEYADRIDISYCEAKVLPADFSDRAKAAAAVLVASGEPEFDPRQEVATLYEGCGIENSKVYIVGYKYFGRIGTIGRYYSRRFFDGYRTQKMQPVPNSIVVANKKMSDKFKSHYFDFLGCQSSGGWRLFDDDGHFLSNDNYHLSVYGARFYARGLSRALLGFCGISL